MNKLRSLQFRILTLLLCFIAMGVYGQKQTKTFKEIFKVSAATSLDVDTSHADIEFETWGKNEVEIEATITIEGATDEEAKSYLENSGFEILGNSKKISITTGFENTWEWTHALGDIQNFHIEIPEFPEMESFNFDFDFKELTAMPMPPVPSMSVFDHKAFKKDGDVYMKKWQKKFEESYDEAYVEKLEKWSKLMEEKQEKMEKRHEEMRAKREKMHEKRSEKQGERLEKMAEIRAERMEEQLERRAQLIERNVRRNKNTSANLMIINGDSIRAFSNKGPSVFYNSSDGAHKNYKVKKTIKVKMPKGMKIKMSVKHGEVKLAENTKNLNANLSHSSLWAATIDGGSTIISASYSPVNVQNWNYGQLQVKYSKKVAIKEVTNLRLNATSSDVTIDHLINSAFIKNTFGPIEIKSISKNFKALDLSLENAEFNCSLPEIPFSLYMNGTASELTSPASIRLDRTENHNTTIHRGYFKNKNAGSSITINAKYSEVVIE